MFKVFFLLNQTKIPVYEVLVGGRGGLANHNAGHGHVVCSAREITVEYRKYFNNAIIERFRSDCLINKKKTKKIEFTQNIVRGYKRGLVVQK